MRTQVTIDSTTINDKITVLLTAITVKLYAAINDALAIDSDRYPSRIRLAGVNVERTLSCCSSNGRVRNRTASVIIGDNILTLNSATLL